MWVKRGNRDKTNIHKIFFFFSSFLWLVFIFIKVLLTYYKLSVRTNLYLQNLSISIERKKKLKENAMVRFHSFSLIDWYYCAYRHTLDRGIFPAASHRWIDGRIIVVVAVGEDQRDTSMRRLTLNTKKRKTGQVKEIFLASSSSSFSTLSLDPLVFYCSFVSLLSQNVRPKAKDSMNTRRTDASVFFLYVHAHLSLSPYIRFKTTTIIDTLFLLFYFDQWTWFDKTTIVFPLFFSLSFPLSSLRQGVFTMIVNMNRHVYIIVEACLTTSITIVSKNNP